MPKKNPPPPPDDEPSFSRGCDHGWDPANRVTRSTSRLADRKVEARVILFPTEASTIGFDRIDAAIARVLARKNQ